MKKSQRPQFQCLIAEDGQQPGWLEAAEVPRLGEQWTLNIGEYPSEERESTLYTILQEETPDKYFLSAKACWGILRRAQEKEKEIPTVLKIALLERIAEEWSRTHTDK